MFVTLKRKNCHQLLVNNIPYLFAFEYRNILRCIYIMVVLDEHLRYITVKGLILFISFLWFTCYSETALGHVSPRSSTLKGDFDFENQL